MASNQFVSKVEFLAAQAKSDAQHAAVMNTLSKLLAASQNEASLETEGSKKY